MRWLSLLQPFSWLPLLFFLCISLADPVNVTIDDQFGDPTNGQLIVYSPSIAWQAGQMCANCAAKVTPASDAYMGTWMDATFNPSGNVTNSAPGQIIRATTTFFGTSVYVVCILIGTSSSPIGNTDMTFKIDNVTVGSFQKAPDNDKTYHFNQTVFAMTGLPNAQHTIAIESGHAGQIALVLLDSIIYTVDNSSTATSTNTLSPITVPPSSAPSQSANGTPNTNNTKGSTNIAMIVGPVVAVITVLALSIALFIFLRRRRRSRGERFSAADFTTGDVRMPRRGGRTYEPKVHGAQYVVSGEPLSEYTENTSVTGYGYPTLASGSATGISTSNGRYPTSTSEITTGILTSTRLGPISPGARSNYTQNVPPSEVGGAVFSDASLLPPYEVDDPLSAVLPPSTRRPLPPNPSRKS